jgi:hypothetical protein
MAYPFDIFEWFEHECRPVDRSSREPGRCPRGDSTETYLIPDHVTGPMGGYKLGKDGLLAP